MSFALSTTAQNQGYRLHVYDRVGSTNTLALWTAERGDPGKLWIVGREQKAGRGRYGRVWHMLGKGNLAVTLLLVYPFCLGSLSGIGFVAGIALIQALNLFCQQGTHAPELFQLKWPNDILGRDAKVAGILVEKKVLNKERMVIAIGFGVNVVNHPCGLPYAATSLDSLGISCSAARLLLNLSQTWIEVNQIWNEEKGFLKIRDLWLSYAANLGKEISVASGNEVKRGIFETIDESYRCVIRLEGEERVHVSSGDMLF